MKVITFGVPCYNSEAYMEKCIESLLVAGEDIQIVIVDDGSKDRTAEIADAYAVKYPTIIKAVHQENGGHGEAVNTGLKNADGLYYKVVDSDDWLDKDSLLKAVAELKKLHSEGNDVDLLVCNYVYERVYEGKSKVIDYTKALPEKTIITWDQIGKFGISRNLLMHTLFYKTQVLRDCKLVLPKHTFYVDNLFAYIPLPYVKTLYYMNLDMYRYFIGRADQSVNEKIMLGRIDQQIRVNKLMMEAYDLEKEVKSYKLREYMYNYLINICMVSSALLNNSRLPENFEKRRELWRWFKANANPDMYKKIRHCVRGIYCNPENPFSRWVTRVLYAIARKIYKFN